MGTLGRLAGLTTTDRLLLLYLGGLAVLASVRLPHPLATLAAIGALAAALLGVARGRSRSPLGTVVHDFFPVAGILGSFLLSGPVIAAANPRRWDAVMAAVDRSLFGALPEAWFGLLGRPDWLVDLASLFYASFYLIPVAMALALYRAGRRDDFQRFVFAVVGTFLVSYLGYLLFPTAGPRVPVALEAERLGGGAISVGLRGFLHWAERTQLDAFPSGHTALALVFAVFAWRMLPRWRVPVAVLAAGIVFATVYLSLHYVIDLVAGAALAAAMPWTLPRLARWVGPRPAGLPHAEVAQRPSSKARQRPDAQPIRSNRPPR